MLPSEVLEILREGDKLLRYAERTISGRNPKLWRHFERRCLMENSIRIEALYESIAILPDYAKYEASMKRIGKNYTLADHLERCISTWIYYRKSREEFPEEWKPKKQVFVYYTQEGKIKATYMEEAYPVYTTPEVTIVRAERLRLCTRCRREMSIDLYGHFYCPECGYNDR